VTMTNVLIMSQQAKASLKKACQKSKLRHGELVLSLSPQMSPSVCLRVILSMKILNDEGEERGRKNNDDSKKPHHAKN